MATWKFQNVYKDRVMLGLLGGGSAVLCTLFPMEFETFRWDLRSIPLFVSILYGGFLSGSIASVMILAARLLQGAEPLLVCFILTTHVMYCIPAFMVLRRYVSMSKRRKMAAASGISLFAFVTILLNFYMYLHLKGVAFPWNQYSVSMLAFTAVIMVSGMMLSILLLESLRDYIKLRERMERSEKVSIIGDLAASVAHEIRNPLTAAGGFMQLAKQTSIAYGRKVDEHRESAGGNTFSRDEELTPVMKIGNYLDTALVELKRAEEIICEYLEFAKPNLKNLEGIHLAATLSEAAREAAEYALAKEIRVTCSVDEQLWIWGDDQRLRQAVLNIAKNGIESMEGDGVLAIRASQLQAHAVITVSDTGHGMDGETIRRLGTPFYTMKEKGTGLGLMVSLKLIQAMNGEASFESRPGKGTTVTIRFPIWEEGRGYRPAAEIK
ncbi:ATP-binding protein [Paenibacillus turpanensis]|uniref:ATP-binding protein n=1 Tax=Paenibacillus turpanensis TaxID=2689078 RepID=UPI00140BDD78|nr:ATP-binding protein [Paenibacillus turpanensis]